MSKFKYGSANKEQIEAIITTEGPLLIIAGPGTGKTFTLVKRAMYLIVEKNVEPNNIMIATFTEKAAKEILTRISNELIKANIKINVNEMYIGTFHSICMRIIKDNIEYTRLKKNFRLLDRFEQQYTIFQNISKFREVENFNLLMGNEKGTWRQSAKLIKYISTVNEELLDYEKFINDENESIKALREVMDIYNQLTEEENLLDFSTIQLEAFNLLMRETSVLSKIQNQIKYLMIDEYQDTNYIQEQIIFKICSTHNNICVVGDDDQGLYRFRGATIRNIFEFPNKFTKGMCKQISLVKNYRSEKKIIDFYNKWMDITYGTRFKFHWGKYRYSKKIIPGREGLKDVESVLKVSSDELESEWQTEILKTIKKLMESKKITDLNQIAFLFRSVKNERVIKLSRFLEKNNIRVYSPRSEMFFDRKELKLIIGAIIATFPLYVNKLNLNEFTYLGEKHNRYYISCLLLFNNYLRESKNDNLKTWIKHRAYEHLSGNSNMDYAYSGLIYQLFQFEPFRSYLDDDLSKGVADLRPLRNLSIFLNMVAKYEYLHNISVLTPKSIDKNTELLFNMYLKFLIDGGIKEFEDDTEYAPSGCVSFLTIHQSKGLEFPIVVVGSLNSTPRKNNDDLLDLLETKYFHRTSFEHKDSIKYYDFWRLYYTAFSRAQNLLILTANVKEGRGKEPSKYFDKTYKSLTELSDLDYDFSEFEFDNVKDVNLKSNYSFTSHILLYENCALQYKFFKEIGFTPVRMGATFFGTLVHQTIEDIHKAVLRKEEKLITKDKITEWFNNNYNYLVKKERTYLGESQQKSALNQVIRYTLRNAELWDKIREAEVEISLVKEDYILEGTVDLVRGDNNTLEIIDFKAEKKPDLFRDKEKIERYRRQLEVYAHIIEERFGEKVSKLNLYYTGEKDGVPVISFPKNSKSIDKTIEEFDKIVGKIQSKDFTKLSQSEVLCSNCDMRYYCKK
ncbi:ATP-dependent helicase [Maledivibacter halophilus]|uniref:DNA 3'-5' helicase n=1 Tax=Maledivibacter halophilus TaxID=36842 RepID=A0A1T5MGF4_9FIRM|nr:ATP-dependent DNA helicase [Maledivibacter halophilus]SKC86988.1 DNA helicase-2 / ATP-dependent DNA helicase PcrA [Maledivibacter halophilus]